MNWSARLWPFLSVLPSELVITQKQGYRLEEMIGEELGHKLAIEITQRFMRVSLQFIAAFSSSWNLSGVLRHWHILWATVLCCAVRFSPFLWSTFTFYLFIFVCFGQGFKKKKSAENRCRTWNFKLLINL